MSRYLGDRRSVVLFDRAHDATEFGDALPLLHHPDLARLLDTYHVNLIPLPGKNKRKKRKKKTRKKKGGVLRAKRDECNELFPWKASGVTGYTMCGQENSEVDMIGGIVVGEYRKALSQ
jgi:hypothetical protein